MQLTVPTAMSPGLNCFGVSSTIPLVCLPSVLAPLGYRWMTIFLLGLFFLLWRLFSALGVVAWMPWCVVVWQFPRCRSRLFSLLLSLGLALLVRVFLVISSFCVKPVLTCLFSLLGPAGAWLISGSLPFISLGWWIPGPQKPACLVSALTS